MNGSEIISLLDGGMYVEICFKKRDGTDRVLLATPWCDLPENESKPVLPEYADYIRVWEKNNGWRTISMGSTVTYSTKTK